MKNRFRGAGRAVRASAVVAGLCVFGGVASAQAPISFRVVDLGSVFTPLHSYVVGEVGDDLVFVSGISGTGLHNLSQAGTSVSFQIANYSTDFVLVDRTLGTVFTGSIAHLPDNIRFAIRMANAATIQIGNVLHIYGGYGPTTADDDWVTRDQIVSVDLVMVQTALRAGMPVPAGAFTVTTSAAAEVTGHRIIEMGDRFALIGGAKFTGDYGRNATATFMTAYSHAIHVFDPAVSMVVPEETFQGATMGSDPFRRRDMNALPAMLPKDGGGIGPGFVVAGGVFRNGFFIWENPLVFADGDAAVVQDMAFTQHMNHYESPVASFYSAANDRNRFALLSGISSHTWDGLNFNPVAGSAFQAPWGTEITEIRVDGGVFTSELVVGAMPGPMSNCDLVYEDNIPRNASGQVLMDGLPANEVLLGRIYGGMRAATTGEMPATFAGDGVLEVYVTFGVRGDVNGDGSVGAGDLAQLLGAWGGSVGKPDLNFDGVVNSADLAQLLGLWGNNTPG